MHYRCMLVFKTLIETLGADEYLWMIPSLVMASSARLRPDAMDTDDREWVSQRQGTEKKSLMRGGIFSTIVFWFYVLQFTSLGISSSSM